MISGFFRHYLNGTRTGFDQIYFHNFNKYGHVIRLFTVFKCEKLNGIVVVVTKQFVLGIIGINILILTLCRPKITPHSITVALPVAALPCEM